MFALRRNYRLLFFCTKNSYLCGHNNPLPPLSDSLVIIPTYNEKENIVKMLQTVFALPHPFHVLVVDDGSPDATGAYTRVRGQFEKLLNLSSEEGKQADALGTAIQDNLKTLADIGTAYGKATTEADSTKLEAA